MITATCPGKLIISGEHAVVHGNPALAIAIDRYVQCRVKFYSTPKITLYSHLLPSVERLDIPTLFELRRVLEQRYKAFKAGECTITEVCRRPAELILFALAEALSCCQLPNKPGLSLELETSLPIGCGLGSSAAVILSIIKVIMKAFQLTLTNDEITHLAHRIENFQHGYSSGLDIQVCHHGGALLYQDNKFYVRQLSDLDFFVVNSGEPAASTGECVALSRRKLADKGLLRDFATITQEIDQAFMDNNLALLTEAIQINHRLLCCLGVVPDKVQRFIEAVEQEGGCAKVCGAGSIRGQAAGYLFILGEAESLQNCCQRFDFKLESLKMVKRKSKVVSHAA